MADIINLEDNIRVLNKINGLNKSNYYRVIYTKDGFACNDILNIISVEINVVTFKSKEGELIDIKVKDIKEILRLNEKYFDFDIQDISYAVMDSEADLKEGFDDCYSEFDSLLESLYSSVAGQIVKVYLTTGENFNAEVVSFNVLGIDLVEKYQYGNIRKIPKLKYTITTSCKTSKYNKTYSSDAIKVIKLINLDEQED